MIPHDTLGYLPETPSQTAGPYVHIGLIPKQAGFDIFENNLGETLVDPDTEGERIRIEGHIFDGTGALVRDALVEIWQADAHGRFNHPADRQETRDPSAAGAAPGKLRDRPLVLQTIKPGRTPAAAAITAWRRISMSGSSRAA